MSHTALAVTATSWLFGGLYIFSHGHEDFGAPVCVLVALMCTIALVMKP